MRDASTALPGDRPAVRAGVDDDTGTAASAPREAPRMLESPPPRQAPADEATAARQRVPPRHFRTRGRLFLAFAALAAAFVAAFGSQLAGLDRMKRALADAQDHEDQMRIALELEGAMRSTFAHQAHFMVGEMGHLTQYRVARERASQLVRQLSARVDEPEALAWLGQIEADARELDRIFQQEVTPVLAGARGDAHIEARTYPLVFRIEENADRLFRLIRARAVEISATIDGERALTVRLAIYFVIGTVAFAIAMALYLSRSVARPLAVIGAGAARIADGDLATRIDLAGNDEFGTLACKLNAMAATLKRDRDALVRSEKLAGLGRMAAGIAHEINNPLQVMIGYLTLNHGRVPGELGRQLLRVEREATRCKEIVDGLLQLSRPAAPPCERLQVDLRAVSNDVAETIRATLPAGGPSILVEGAATALGTPGSFRQIVLNLVKNAAEAAGPGGAVDIRVRCDGERAAEVEVSDTGPGIPPEVGDRMFEPFFTTKARGTGLGLALARAVARALGGDIELGRSESGGARFTLRVPRTEGGTS